MASRFFHCGRRNFRHNQVPFSWTEHRDRAKAMKVSNEGVNNVFLIIELTMSNLLPRSRTGMEFGSTGIISTFDVSMAPSVSLVTLVLEAILRKSCFQAPASSIFASSVMSTTTRNRQNISMILTLSYQSSYFNIHGHKVMMSICSIASYAHF